MKKESNVGYYIFRTILKPIYWLLYHPKIVGKENIPKKGPVLFCGNHRHVLDQCPVLIATRLPVHYMAKKEYFDSKMAWFFKAVGCIPVNRQIHDEEAKERALNVLRNNGAIGIFPEGTRNKTKEVLLPLKFGCVSMAKKTNAYIVPFSITGSYNIFKRNLKLIYGKPYKVTGDLEVENEKLMKKVKELIKKGREMNE